MGPAWRHPRELAPNDEGQSHFCVAGSCMEGCAWGCRESGFGTEEQQPLGKRETCLQLLFAVLFSAVLL